MQPQRGPGGGFTYGARPPRAVIGLLIALIGLSVVGKLTNTAELLVLVPERVLAGEVWRLLTWAFCEPDPKNLMFTAVTLFFFGGALTEMYGERKFVGVTLGLTVITGVVTTLVVGLLLQQSTYYGGFSAVISGLVIAWCLANYARTAMMVFLPMTGRMMFFAEVGFSLIFAIFYGLVPMFAVLTAQLLMVLYTRGRRALLRLRMLWIQRRLHVVEDVPPPSPFQPPKRPGSKKPIEWN